jgi:hypothetical protein
MDGEKSNMSLGASVSTEVLLLNCALGVEIPRDWMYTRSTMLAFICSKRKLGFLMLVCCICMLRLNTQLAYYQNTE